MKIQETFHNVKCDNCGGLLDPDVYYESEELAEQVFNELGFKHLGGKDYCYNCWGWDDDDNIITKDGRKFNGDTEEEIL